MTIEYNTAKHICNVARRHITGVFPDLYINFILHKENGRREAFLKEENIIAQSQEGLAMISYLKNSKSHNILEKNRSRFAGISYHDNTRFLSLLKNKSYLAMCFLNYERFDTEDNMRNHVLHIVWHAISLYQNILNNNDNLVIKKNIVTPKLTSSQLHHLNLKADIFSASLQTLQGRDNALSILSKQRMNDTLSAEAGFYAERFPFPVCLDTLDYIFKSNIEQYKKGKKPVLSAIKIAEEIGATYKDISIEQWRSFSLPAQEMAWFGHDHATILGTAIYTSENAYAQAIADMIAERLDIRPDFITTLQEYNSFTPQEANERMHKKQCSELINKLINKIKESSDYSILLEVASKQNQALFTSSSIGWCASALIRAADIIRGHNNTQDLSLTLDNAKYAFEKEVTSIAWDTLVIFSRTIFKNRRNGRAKAMNDVINIAKINDEYASIYQALNATENTEKDISPVIANITTQSKEQSITDFISPNAIKKSEQ